MRCMIRSETRGRIRIHADISRMTLEQADILEYYLRAIDGVSNVSVYDRTCDAVITYTCSREVITDALARFSFSQDRIRALVPEHTGRAMNREYENRLADTVLIRYARKLFLPHSLRVLWCIYKASGYIATGLKALWNGQINVSVLDAAAITVSLVRGDHETASSVMFLLGIGDLLEEWSHKKSVDDLAGMMALNVDKAWCVRNDKELLVPVGEIAAGEEVIVRMGNMIPLDGKVSKGMAMVNQAAMTGESMPVRKSRGSYVYGGTVVEEGECRFIVDKTAGSGRYDRIVKMIEESESLKSVTESRAADLADRLVPFSLGGTIAAYVLTRNTQTALAFLMVDYSCALKLTMPLAVLAAMRECGRHHITVKGGKFLEKISEADTIVFDKTGTLTHATPAVVSITTFDGYSEHDALQLAACLEEHYPHSIANAVVEEARKRGIDHEERHSAVEYVVAHGITSYIDGMKASIGSYHFIFEDEMTMVAEEERKLLDELPDEYSKLYMSVDGRLAAVLCIDDPVRDNVSKVMDELRSRGFRRIVMMTGDSEKTASHVAGKAGVDEYIAEVLPEDKAAYIRSARSAGHKVIMIGDGINDSPALSESDAGIAVNSGAAIAREIADVTIEAEDLSELIVLKDIADALMARTHMDYRFIISFNTILILLGASGIITPATSAMLHNLSTLSIGAYNMTDLLK